MVLSRWYQARTSDVDSSGTHVRRLRDWRREEPRMQKAYLPHDIMQLFRSVRRHIMLLRNGTLRCYLYDQPENYRYRSNTQLHHRLRPRRRRQVERRIHVAVAEADLD